MLFLDCYKGKRHIKDTYHQYYEEKNRPYNIEDKIFFEDNDFENIEKQKKKVSNFSIL